MGLLDLFFRPKKSEGGSAATISWTDGGIDVRFVRPLAEMTPEGLLEASRGATEAQALLGAYLSQLAIEELCFIRPDAVHIGWSRLFELLRSDEHNGMLRLLELPPGRDLRPVLGHVNSLSDEGFEIRIDGWVEEGSQVTVDRRVGAVVYAGGKAALLGEAAWRTVDAIDRFSSRGAAARSQHENELAWGRIREIADQAGAMYSSKYLETSYVLTPRMLRLPLTREDSPFGRVYTVAPTFARAPAEWLRAFDAFDSVQAHYDLTRGTGGRIRIVVSEPVRKVLEVIKREMPGRRVSGARAERFLHNPWAFLGDTAEEVIDEEAFAKDKAGAGPLSTSFELVPRIADGRVVSVALSITEAFEDGTVGSHESVFGDVSTLEDFAGRLEKAIAEQRERFPWQEFDLDIDAEAGRSLERAGQIAALWRAQSSAPIRYDEIYALADYSERIEGFGVAGPIYIPVFQKPSREEEEESGWLPSDLTPMVRVVLAGHEGEVLVPLSRGWVDEFEAQVALAEESGAEVVKNEALPSPLETAQARRLVDGFRKMLGAQDQVRGEGVGSPKVEKPDRETLLVKTNFHGVDYREERRVALTVPQDAQAQLPATLRPGITLKKHQLAGIAWFQHLVSRAPRDCRGALLADDMGLGKTLQLLCVLGQYYERNPGAHPSVVFAPKSLLENWANEAARFFTPSYPKLLVLYGDELKRRKQPQSLIDRQLLEKGVCDLLVPDWVGTAKVIVTTYEVLTRFEFSFARQPFSFVICDEAQRIKTPGTQVTLAAKKLKADFRVACTGTPVENSLADLWCLFDFIQPGLLGALEDFGNTYRRPIECETEDQKAALAGLQAMIAPQVLRRTKADIADELPRKLFATKLARDAKLAFHERPEEGWRLALPISEYQRILYKGGLQKLREASKERDGRARARLSFGALHLMKAVCAEPYCLPGARFEMDREGIDAHLANSPKLEWLLTQLERVREAGEKAIVFTELREVQAALTWFLGERFGLRPFVINGDSEGRQRYIDRFSATQGFDVIILSTLAAGAGLNVTAANHVFHFTRAWNPSKENQATDRAYRIGQRRDVYVYCPTVVADDFPTFEVRLDELLRKKSGLADSAMDADGMAAMLNGGGRDLSFKELVGPEIGVSDGSAMSAHAISQLDERALKALCALLWSREGFRVMEPPVEIENGGVDLIAFRGDEGVLISCGVGRNGGANSDENEYIQRYYRGRHPGALFRRVNVGALPIASQASSGPAASMGDDFLGAADLAELCARHSVSRLDVDEMLVGGAVDQAA